MTPAEKTRLLAERVMGWNIRQANSGKWVAMIPDGDYVSTVGLCEYSWTFKTWSPLTNLSHAGEVLEAMAKKGWSARIATNACAADQNSCEFFKAGLGLGRSLFAGSYSEYGPDKRVAAVAEIISTAICHAALLVVGVKEEEL